MKAKTINAVLCKKFDQYLESVEDAKVKELIKNNTIITGGSIVSMLLKSNVNDYDLYFRSKDVALAVAQYYVNKFNASHNMAIEVKSEPRVKLHIASAGQASENEEEEDVEIEEEKEDTGPKYRPIYLTANAITLANKVQLVIRFYGEPEEIHKNYDFEHCTNYWTSWDRQLTLRKEALESILTKELRYRGSLYPICSVIRTRKFIAQQWTINAGQYLKMCWQISKLDLTDIKVLEDQLIGVDATYFVSLINRLSTVDLKSVDSSYVAETIDKIF